VLEVLRALELDLLEVDIPEDTVDLLDDAGATLLVEDTGVIVYTSSLFPAPQNSEEFPLQTILQSEVPPGASAPPLTIALPQSNLKS
jgi:hypothetical protein